MTSQFQIPSQLKDERFIVLFPASKRPKDPWKNPEYQFNAEKIANWIDHGFNYALVYTTDICVVDADNADILEKYGVLPALQPTYTVKSGRKTSHGLHLYLRISQVPPEMQGKKIELFDQETHKSLGDVRLPHSPFYNVAPYSWHPSGRKYLPLDETMPIRTISYETLNTALSSVISKTKSETCGRTKRDPTIASSDLDAYGYTCFDFLMPKNPKMRADGSIEGEHPIHGSNTGTNPTISPNGAVWWCAEDAMREGTGRKHWRWRMGLYPAKMQENR